jgi:NhaA family Na+:H+ antiporter
VDLTLPVGPRDHVRGPRDAAVTIVEYGDVECPYCGRLEPVLQELLATRDDVRVVWRHFPLIEPHPHAYSAALALEAAGARFWELHDLLIAHQDTLGRTALAAHAVSLGLPPESVLRPASDRFDVRVRDDFDSGVASGVEGTPALFVNGQRFEGGPSLRRLTEAIERIVG